MNRMNSGASDSCSGRRELVEAEPSMTQSASIYGNEGVGAKRGLWPLEALNFFMADMQAGIGPFLGVFLLRSEERR